MFKGFTKYLLACFILGLITFTPSAYSADLHAVLIGDTTDSSLGNAFQKDLDMMQEEMKKIAKETNLTLNVTLLQGKSVTPKSLWKHIKSLKINSDDAVVLYFTIHGFRTPEKSTQWPNLYFNVSQEGVDFFAVHEMVKKKNPRFLLSIADSCNSELPSGWIPMITPNLLQVIKLNSKKIQENYRKLFLENRGSVIISSSTPGQYSWAYTSVGGIYTLKFLDSLHETVQKNGDIDWIQLLENTSLKVVHETANFESMQTPQYKIDQGNQSNKENDNPNKKDDKKLKKRGLSD